MPNKQLWHSIEADVMFSPHYQQSDRQKKHNINNPRSPRDTNPSSHVMSALLCRTEKLLLLSPLRPVRALSTIVSPNGLARAAIQPGRSAFIRPFSLARSGESGQGSEKVWNF